LCNGVAPGHSSTFGAIWPDMLENWVGSPITFIFQNEQLEQNLLK
jgi:hypothetical protein